MPLERDWEAAARGPDGCKYACCGECEDGILRTLESGLENLFGTPEVMERLADALREARLPE